MNGAARLLLLAVLLPCGLTGKPAYHLYRNNTPQKAVQSSNNIADTSYSSLQNDVEAHDIEIRMLEERINTQDILLETLRKQFSSPQAANKGANSALEKRVAKAEANDDAIIKDIRGLQTHSNDTSKALSQYKQKILDLEAELSRMKASVDTIYTALQIDDSGKGSSGANTYQVKAGDRLEKIAKDNNTTIGKIKELNNLKNDKIFIGQHLKLP